MSCAPSFYPCIGAKWVENSVGDYITYIIFILIEVAHDVKTNKTLNIVVASVVFVLFGIIFYSYVRALTFTYVQVNALIWAVSFITLIGYCWDIVYLAGFDNYLSAFQITTILFYPTYKICYVIALHMNNKILVSVLEAEEQGFAFLDINNPVKWVNLSLIHI